METQPLFLFITFVLTNRETERSSKDYLEDSESLPAEPFQANGNPHHADEEEVDKESSSSDSADDKEEEPTPEFNVTATPLSTTPLSTTPNNFMNESLMDFVNSLISPSDNINSPIHQFPPVVGSPPTLTPIQSTHLMPSSPPREITSFIVNQQNNGFGRLAKITEFAPEWDYCDGGTKILIMGPDFHSGLNYCCMFDQTEVPAEVVQDGVLKCRSPPNQKAGIVSFCVTKGNFVLFSEVTQFEFRKRQGSNELMFSIPDRSFKLRIIERLEKLEREVNSGSMMDSIVLSETIMESLAQTMEDKYLTEDHLEQLFVKILANLLEGLENRDAINARDNDGLTLLHYSCALRYHLLASTLIQFGVNVNTQDRNGNTPFHWAMKNRDQKMIKMLVDYVDLSKSAYNTYDFGYANKTSQSDFTFGSSPKAHTRISSLDNIITGIDDLELQRATTTTTTTAQPLQIPHPSHSHHSSHPPHTGHSKQLSRSRNLSIGRRQMEHDAAAKIQGAFKVFRQRRLEKTEDDYQKRSHKARDSKVALKRK